MAQYGANWLEMMKPTIRLRTWTRYRELLTLHVVPTLGKLPLSKLTVQLVLTLYRAKLDEGLSPTTVHHLGTVLHGALALASNVNPKVVSEMLGHSTVAITLDIYSHVLPDMQEDAAATIAAILYSSWGGCERATLG